MPLILAVASLTLLGSFVCSLFEAALYSVTPSKLEVLVSRGRRGARKLAALRENIEEPIAAILTVNTITHTVGAAACGALVGERYGDAAVGVFAAVFTLAVLLLTEIVPKSIGVRYATTVGPRIAWPLQWMMWIVWPVARGSSLLMRLFTSGAGSGAPSEEEVLVLSRLAGRGGEIRPQELRWVENALRLDRATARDLVTPRTVVFSRDAEARIGDLAEEVRGWTYTRIPIVEGGGLDGAVGLVHRWDVLRAVVEGRVDERLRDLARPLDAVPGSMPGHRLLDEFLRARRHMSVVVDEYGGALGVVTLEDVLEHLLGSQIVDEWDQVPDLREHARRLAERDRD